MVEYASLPWVLLDVTYTGKHLFRDALQPPHIPYNSLAVNGAEPLCASVEGGAGQHTDGLGHQNHTPQLEATRKKGFSCS